MAKNGKCLKEIKKERKKNEFSRVTGVQSLPPEKYDLFLISCENGYGRHFTCEWTQSRNRRLKYDASQQYNNDECGIITVLWGRTRYPLMPCCPSCKIIVKSPTTKNVETTKWINFRIICSTENQCFGTIQYTQWRQHIYKYLLQTDMTRWTLSISSVFCHLSWWQTAICRSFDALKSDYYRLQTGRQS